MKTAFAPCLCVAWVIALLLASVTESAQSGPLRDRIMQRRAQGDQSQGNEMLDAGARGTANLPADIRVVRDVAYGPAPRQRFDVYTPPHAANAPVIFMVHGGAWMFGDKTAKSVVENKVAHWAQRGFIVISVNYRMIPEAAPLDQARDVARALAFAQKHAVDWGGDAKKFVLMGHSAGAHLVALISAVPELAREQGALPWLGTVALDSGAYDVTDIMRKPHYWFYDKAFGSDPAYWAQTSPTQRLQSAGAPFLAVCSSRREISCPEAQRFVAKANALGMRAQLQPEDKTHGQINATLGADPVYTAQVDAFLRKLDPAIAKLLGE